jgi:hypothetical protein
MDLDICTTATLRPELLDHTYTSFQKHLFHGWKGYRVILNVDPVGDDCDPMEVVAVAQKHFEIVRHRIAKEPNFPMAFKWCWLNVCNEYMFYLEDDWELFADVDLLDMVRIMEANPDLALLRLPFFHSRAETCRQWNRHIPWNEEAGFFEVPEEKKGQLGYSGHPSLIRGSFVRQMTPWLRADWCPEKTLKGYVPPVKQLLMQWRYGIYQKPLSSPVIRDIGRPWREKRRLYKHRGYSFTTWELMDEGHDEKTWYHAHYKKRR